MDVAQDLLVISSVVIVSLIQILLLGCGMLVCGACGTPVTNYNKCLALPFVNALIFG